MSLAAVRRLVELRFCLVEFSLDVVEERCAAEVHRALDQAKKTPAEIILEEFTCCTPEPCSTHQVKTWS